MFSKNVSKRNTIIFILFAVTRNLNVMQYKTKTYVLRDYVYGCNTFSDVKREYGDDSFTDFS